MKKNSVLKLHTKIKTASDYQPTFADLALLHEYDPDNFKKLTLTGFNKTDQKLEIFDAATWPDLPIATAMRISMAIPGIIDPIILNKNGRDLTMIDGGVNANLPTHLVDPFATGSTLSRDGITDTEKDAIVASTIALSFAHGGKGQKALDQGADSIQMPWYKRIYATFMAPNKIEAFRDDTQRFVERGLNGLLADNDKLETLSFGASKEAIDAAHVTAEVRFIDSLRRNGVADRDRAMYRTYATIDEAVSTIKEADLRAFLQTPLPADPSDAIVQFTAAAKAHIDEIDLKRSKTQAS